MFLHFYSSATCLLIPLHKLFSRRPGFYSRLLIGWCSHGSIWCHGRLILTPNPLPKDQNIPSHSAETQKILPVGSNQSCPMEAFDHVSTLAPSVWHGNIRNYMDNTQTAQFSKKEHLSFCCLFNFMPFDHKPSKYFPYVHCTLPTSYKTLLPRIAVLLS